MIIVTGVSRGLGKAIAEKFLSEGQTVLGIGRSSSIEHQNYSFEKLDLSNINELNTFELELPNKPITLINNAGIIGTIKRLSEQINPDITDVLQVNTAAPVILTNKIYNQVENKDEFVLVNISSGAANRAIPSWAAYCASKSALNMLSECFVLEEKEMGHSPKVYAVAPGVIDTGMQEQIRSASEADFSAVQNFQRLKEENELFSPEEAASRLFKLLSLPYSGEVTYDLRNI